MEIVLLDSGSSLTGNVVRKVYLSVWLGFMPKRVEQDSNVDYLLMCVKDTRLSCFPTALAYPKLLDIKSDQQLFEVMQPLYYERRSRVISMFSMRTLKSIQFVRVYSISFTPDFCNCESA